MKKLIVLGLAVVGLPVCAQSTWELYGLIDAGVTRVSGLKGGSVTQLNSGIMEGSRWGLKGKEDLGGGYQAIFTLESRFEVDTGAMTNRPVTGTQLPDRLATPAALGLPDTPTNRATVTAVGTSLANAEFGVNIPGRLFDRQAFMGLITPVGAVLAGRQYTPGFEALSTFDTMHIQSSLSPSQLVGFPPAVDIRLSNTAAYRIETNDVVGSLMWAPGEASSPGRFAGMLAIYKGANFSVGAAHNSRDNEIGEDSLTSTVLGATVNVGSGVVSTVFSSFKDDHPTGMTAVPAGPLRTAFSNALRQDGRVAHIGYRHMFGVNTLSVAYNIFNDRRPANTDAASYGVAYTYALSKRTDVNTVFTHVDNKTAGQSAPGGNGYLGGVAASPGKDVNSLAFSLRHRF